MNRSTDISGVSIQRSEMVFEVKKTGSEYLADGNPFDEDGWAFQFNKVIWGVSHGMYEALPPPSRA